MSKIGRIPFSALLDLAIKTPIGIPTTIHIIVHTVIIATVAMQSFHIPKYPISINAIALPTTNFQLLEPNQAKIPMTIIIIGYFGMWNDCMATVAIITVCTIICIAVGIPIGVVMSKYDRAEKGILPVLDMMQTIPSFVYLVPILMLLGIGKVPGLIAVCIYAVPPVIRLTNLGIREVDKEILEACDSYGATPFQKLTTVQIPLSLPTIFAGVNQTIMMALAMVVIASMIGVKGLGVPILRAISNQYLALGLLNGLAIVALAIIFDRITQEYGRRIQKHRGQKK